MQSNIEEIPGLAEAIEKEQTRRNLAFSDSLLPVGGVWVQQFTPWHWVNLGLIRSPFLGGDRGQPYSSAAVLEFLWIVSPQYRPAAYWRQLWFFVRNYGTIRPATAAAIYDYLDAAFQDAPARQIGAPQSRSYFAGITSLMDFFGREYGWDDAMTMRKPLARLFQYFKCHQQRNDPKMPLFNPSDRVRGQALHARNSAAKN